MMGLLNGLGTGTPEDNAARASEFGAEIKAHLLEAGAIEAALASAADPASNSPEEEARAIALGAEVEAIAIETERERRETVARVALLNEARAARAMALDRLRTERAALGS